jgi:pyruvate ferredoxin oxidoreductase beta subunit
MDKFSLYVAQFLTFKEHFTSKGHNACKGCGVALAVRHVYKSLEGMVQTIEKAKWQIPWEQSLIVSKEVSSAGMQPALLSIPKEEDKKGNMLYICFDNESAEGKIDSSILIKRLPAIAAASGYAYAATASPSHPFDLIEKAIKGWEADGSAFIHILCPCPVGWGFDPQDAVRLGRIAVETRLFPLYEIAGGYYQITIDEPNPRPLKDYIKRQERFSSWKAKKIEALQEEVNTAFNTLTDKVNKGTGM